MKAGYSPNLEGDLIRLLSILDTSRYRIEQTSSQREHTTILKHLNFMVDAIIAVADRHITSKVVSRDANHALQKISEFYATYRSLIPDRLTIRLSLFPFKPKFHTRDPIERDLFLRCLTLFHEIVQVYFSLFTQRFESSLKARDWVEVAAGFLVELKQTTRTLNPI